MAQNATYEDATLDAWYDALMNLLDLATAASDRATVLANLRFIAHQIDLLDSWPLDNTIEPAPIFRA